MSEKPLRIAALVGPTASGKTAVALALAARFGLPIEVIGCDALQVYRRLEAGTAKPSPAERATVSHHLIDVAEPTEPMTAGRYAELASVAIAQVHARGNWPLLVGGTGLYLRTLVRGLAEIPPVPKDLRDALAHEFAARGPDALHAELAAVDSAYAAGVPAQNRQRVLRALEVFRATGKPFSQWHREHASQPDRFACWTALLDPPRDAHDARLTARAQSMAAPLLQEVRLLLDEGLPPEAPAMQALGYREAVAVVRDELAPAAFTQALVRTHRQYAKRQRTWFATQQRIDRRLIQVELTEVLELAADLRLWFAS
jgi:tRNA dimethylallyltransferase